MPTLRLAVDAKRLWWGALPGKKEYAAFVLV
jgi:hypothetical protein